MNYKIKYKIQQLHSVQFRLPLSQMLASSQFHGDEVVFSNILLSPILGENSTLPSKLARETKKGNFTRITRRRNWVHRFNKEKIGAFAACNSGGALRVLGRPHFTNQLSVDALAHCFSKTYDVSIFIIGPSSVFLLHRTSYCLMSPLCVTLLTHHWFVIYNLTSCFGFISHRTFASPTYHLSILCIFDVKGVPSSNSSLPVL